MKVGRFPDVVASAVFSTLFSSSTLIYEARQQQYKRESSKMHFIQVPRGQRKSGSNSNISQRAALRIFETGWGAAATAAAFSSKKFQFSHGTSRFQEGDAGGLKSSKVFQRLELKHLKVERVSTLHNRRHESDRSQSSRSNFGMTRKACGIQSLSQCLDYTKNVSFSCQLNSRQNGDGQH